MRRSFARLLTADLTASASMRGAGSFSDSAAEAGAPLLVFGAGAAIGGLAVVFASSSTIDSLKQKISNMNKKYQTKGT